MNKMMQIGTTYMYEPIKINQYGKIGFVGKIKQNIPYNIFPAAKRDDQTLIKIPSFKTFGKPEDVEVFDFVQFVLKWSFQRLVVF